MGRRANSFWRHLRFRQLLGLLVWAAQVWFKPLGFSAHLWPRRPIFFRNIKELYIGIINRSPKKVGFFGYRQGLSKGLGCGFGVVVSGLKV